MRFVMKRLMVNLVAFAVIGIGGLALTAPNANANVQCKGGWELQCDGGECCTVCQASGEIGDCE